MKLSIVIAVLNSPEIVRRQLLFFKKMNLPDDIEIVFVDDGSKPPLECEPIKNFRLLKTNDFREWTQPAARNFGVKNAYGEKVIVTDIDHIIDRKLIDFVYNDTEYSMIKFRREAAVLLEDGTFTQDEEELRRWGLVEKYVRRKKMGPHTNSFAMDRELYLQHGGVSERLVGTGKYPNREEQTIRARARCDARKGRIKILEKTSANQEVRPVLYMFPNGRFCGSNDFNPFGFFHTLSREKWWQKNAKGPGKDGYRRD
jgi:glycosyltransferase involved in cell wall biosynthesis